MYLYTPVQHLLTQLYVFKFQMASGGREFSSVDREGHGGGGHDVEQCLLTKLNTLNVLKHFK